MRLTLRTMLAYLDDILEPTDAEEIGRKIEENEVATNLVNRIRDTTRRLRLGAPKLHGRGMGVDPNTVAEYLDNTLPAERVPEFEKVCLESDVHLAEVASAHQILTLVLGEPAHVEPASRERMYRLAGARDRTVDAAAAGHIPPPHADELQQPATRAARPKPEIPGYLREEQPLRSRLVPVVVAAALLMMLGVVVMQVVGPLDGFFATQPTAEPPERDAAVAEAADAQPPAPVAESLPDEAPQDEPGQPTLAAPPSPVPDKATDALPEEPTETATARAVQPVSDEAAADAEEPADEPLAEPPLPVDVLPPTQSDVADAAPSETPVIEPQPREEMPLEEAVPVDVSPDAGEVADVVETPAVPLPEVPQDPATDVPPNDPRPAAAAGVARRIEPLAPVEAPQPEAPPREEPAVGLGRLLADSDVVLRLDPSTDEWQQLPSAQIVYPGDRLLALPTFRTTIMLSAGVTVKVLGGSEVELGTDPHGGGLPSLRLRYGRVVLMTAGKPGAEMWIEAGDRRGGVRFEDPETSMALSAAPSRTIGVDPARVTPSWEVDLYVTSGRLSWQPVEGAALDLQGPAHRRLHQDPAQQVEATTFPTWTRGAEEIRQIEQRAMNFMKGNLDAQRPIELNLRELATNRRPEVVSLAVRCLVYLDDYEPIIEALRDPNQKVDWLDHHVPTLVEAAARDPENAEKIRAAFETRRPGAAEELYRQLWGYDVAQLEEGAALQLIEGLDHPDLDVRVLSFWNLSDITGFTLFYRPEYPEQRRHSFVQKWRHKYDAGLVVPKDAAE